MKNRVFALLLCILLCLSMFPASALAEDDRYFSITIVINGNVESVSDDTPIPSSGEYELNLNYQNNHLLKLHL